MGQVPVPLKCPFPETRPSLSFCPLTCHKGCRGFSVAVCTVKLPNNCHFIFQLPSPSIIRCSVFLQATIILHQIHVCFNLLSKSKLEQSCKEIMVPEVHQPQGPQLLDFGIVDAQLRFVNLDTSLFSFILREWWTV